MQSNKANAVWASQTSSQTVGVNNWTQYQLSLTGSSYKFQINSAATTSTNLQYYTNREGVDITAGNSILLSTNGSTFTSGTAGAVAFVGGLGTGLSSTGWANQGASYAPTNLRTGANYISPDGTKLYQMNEASLGSLSYRVYQFNLSTPFDITTISWSGNSSPVYTDPGGYGLGMTFKSDGTVLYVSFYNTGTTTMVRAYALSTAWDVSTASSTAIAQVTLTHPSASGGWTNGTPYGFITISPDGTKLIGCQIISAYYSMTPGASYGRGNFAVYSLSVPWVLSTCATTTTNYTDMTTLMGATDGNTPGFYMSPDGLTVTTVFRPSNTSTGPTARTIVLGSPYNFGTGGSFPLTTVNASGSFLAASNPRTIAFFNGSGNTFTYNDCAAGGAYATSLNNTLYGKYNVNISGFSLGSAPTFAYNAAPTVRVDAESTSGRINMFPYEVYQASSTTSQAVIYKPTSGYLAANDTVLLNGTTSVTLSSVTEGTNLGVAAVPITTAANRTYSGKALALSINNTNRNFNFRISPDGGTLIAGLRSGLYGQGLYQYALATPWDINTATFVNFLALNRDDTSSYSSQTVAFDVNPAGTKLYLFGYSLIGQSAPSNMVIREYNIQTWNIAPIVFSGNSWDSGRGIGGDVPTCVRFVPNGTQFVVLYNNEPSAGNTQTIAYKTCATPYNVSTATSGGITWASTSFSTGDVQSVTFTPDGLNIITQGLVTTFNTLSTANNMATASTANNISSAATRWTWPTGTMSSSSARAFGGEFSPDGTKYYVINGESTGTGNNFIWQMNVMVTPQTSYTCNFPTQVSAPTSVVVPDRSTAQSITTTLSGGNMTFAATAQPTNARAIATKITAPGNFTTVTNATLSMWRA